VVHGSVREFEVGVFVDDARHNHVLGISSFRNYFAGHIVAACTRSLVRNSSGNGSVTPMGGTGIYLFTSDHVRILHSSFRNNGDRGIGVFFDSTHNLIKGNLISRNRAVGIVFEQSDRNRLRRNRLIGGDGIVVPRGDRNVIARNRLRGGGGIGIENAHGNVIARNVIVGARREGIYLGLKSPPIGGGNNVVRRNRVRRSGGDAFSVTEKDDHSLLRRNVAKRAGNDGFDVESRSAKLTRNRAVRNIDLGIEAVRGVRDGGGNVANHNGDRRQCTHIVCR
jgi:parallel beta-helix repeat protein